MTDLDLDKIGSLFAKVIHGESITTRERDEMADGGSRLIAELREAGEAKERAQTAFQQANGCHVSWWWEEGKQRARAEKAEAERDEAIRLYDETLDVLVEVEQTCRRLTPGIMAEKGDENPHGEESNASWYPRLVDLAIDLYRMQLVMIADTVRPDLPTYVALGSVVSDVRALAEARAARTVPDDVLRAITRALETADAYDREYDGHAPAYVATVRTWLATLDAEPHQTSSASVDVPRAAECSRVPPSGGDSGGLRATPPRREPRIGDNIAATVRKARAATLHETVVYEHGYAEGFEAARAACLRILAEHPYDPDDDDAVAIGAIRALKPDGAR